MNVTVYGVFENVKYLWFFIVTSQISSHFMSLYLNVIAFKNNGKSYAFEPVANDTSQITYESNYTNKSKAHPPGWALAFNTKTL